MELNIRNENNYNPQELDFIDYAISNKKNYDPEELDFIDYSLQQQNGKSFDETKLPEKKLELVPETALTTRDIVRTGSRVLETLGGIPAGMYALTKAGTDYIRSLDPRMKDLDESVTSKIIDYIGSRLPTQQDLQKVSEHMSSGYTTAQTPGEESVDEVIKTFTNFMAARPSAQNVLGARTGVGARTPLVRNSIDVATKLGQSVAAEGVKHGFNKMGYSDSQAEKAKMGSLLLMSFLSPWATGQNTVNNYINNLYNKRNNLIPQGTRFATGPLLNQVKNLRKKILTGSSPAKSSVRTYVDNIIDQLENNPNLEPEQYFEMVRDLNRSRDAIYQSMSDKTNIGHARRLWEQVDDVISGYIDQSMRQISPQAQNAHRAAQNAYAVNQSSRQASQIITKELKKVSPNTALLFGSGAAAGAYMNPFLSGSAATAAGSAGLVLKTIETILTMRDPSLRRYYSSVIQNALAENIPAMNSSAQKLEKKLKQINQKNEKKD